MEAAVGLHAFLDPYFFDPVAGLSYGIGGLGSGSRPQTSGGHDGSGGVAIRDSLP